MRTLIIVPGYGCDKDKVAPYYQEIARRCLGELSRGKKLLLITSGGYTDPKNHPGVSEAKLGQQILRSSGLAQLSIGLENRAWTTIENLLFSDALIRLLIARDGFQFDKIIIFCDSSRKFKIKVMAGLVLGTMFHQPIQVIGIDMNRTNKEKFAQWFIKTPLEIIDCLLHWPGQFMTARRFAEWQTSGHRD